MFDTFAVSFAATVHVEFVIEHVVTYHVESRFSSVFLATGR